MISVIPKDHMNFSQTLKMKLANRRAPAKPSYLTNRRKPNRPQKALELCIDLPEDEEPMPKPSSTTPNGTQKSTGLIQHGKNSPTALAYRSLFMNKAFSRAGMM